MDKVQLSTVGTVLAYVTMVMSLGIVLGIVAAINYVERPYDKPVPPAEVVGFLLGGLGVLSLFLGSFGLWPYL